MAMSTQVQRDIQNSPKIRHDGDIGFKLSEAQADDELTTYENRFSGRNLLDLKLKH